MALASTSFKISKLTDKDIFARLTNVTKKQSLEVKQLAIHFSIGGHLSLGSLLESNAELEEILNQNSEIVSSFSSTVFLSGTQQHFSLSFSRQPDQKIDTFTIGLTTLPDNQMILASKIVSALRKEFEAFHSSGTADRELGDAMKAQYQASEERLQKLEGISQSLIFDQERNRQTLEENYRKRIKELEDANEKKKATLEEKEQELVKKLRAIDDRESRHVRRALANDLKKIFESRSEKFTLSKGTVDLRYPIQVFTIVLLTALGSLFMLSSFASLKLFGLSADSTPEHIIRQIGLAIAFASTAVFYMRWNNRWFEKHSNEEFMLKRLEIDIDRASWAVELASEWLDREREIPDSLMSKLTTNLFIYESKEPDPLHPADQLASAIFGVASKASVKLGNGTELEFDRKSQKDLKRPIE